VSSQHQSGCIVIVYWLSAVAVLNYAVLFDLTALNQPRILHAQGDISISARIECGSHGT